MPTIRLTFHKSARLEPLQPVYMILYKSNTWTKKAIHRLDPYRQWAIAPIEVGNVSLRMRYDEGYKH